MTDFPEGSRDAIDVMREHGDKWSLRPYPSELVRDVVTDHGEILRLRPIRPDDAELLVRFHQGLSSDSIYRRYFSIHPELSDAEVRHLTQVDYVDRFAFIVESGSDLVAVGRYDRIPGTTEAEVAFIVDRRATSIRASGCCCSTTSPTKRGSSASPTFIAETQADNRDMMGVFQTSGFAGDVQARRRGDHRAFPIQPTDQSRPSGGADRITLAARDAETDPDADHQRPSTTPATRTPATPSARTG